MTKYIKADWLLDRAIPLGWSTPKWVSTIKIEDAPAADVRENFHAYWEDVPYMRHTKRCSNCHNYLDMRGVNAGRGDANFCPNCGAVMDVVVAKNATTTDIDITKTRVNIESLAPEA